MFNIGSIVSAVRRLGALTLEQMVAALGSTLWLDATETYAKSKVAVNFNNRYMYQYNDAFVFGNGTTDSAFSGVCRAKIIFNDNRVFFSRRDISTSYAFRQIATKLTFYCWDQSTGGYIGRQLSTGLAAYASDYHEYAFTYDGSGLSSGIKLYIDGVRVDDADYQGGFYTAMESLENSLFLGASPVDSLLFNHDQDCNRMFDKELTGPEVSYICDPIGDASNVGLNWKDLDGTETFYGNIVYWNDFNTPTDFGKNYAYTGSTISPDKLILDGTSDYLTKTTATDFNFAGNTAFSCGGWFTFNRIKTANGQHQVLIANGNGTSYLQWAFYQQGDGASGNIALLIYGALTGNSYLIATFSASVLSIGTEYNLTATFSGNKADPDKGLAIYLNGVAQTLTVSEVGTFSGMPSLDILSIGGTLNNFGAAQARFAGFMRNLYVYSDKLTSGEASTLYNGGTSAEASTLHSASLISSFPLTEKTTGTIGTDAFASNDLTPVSIVDASFYGGIRELDFELVDVTSANVADGDIEGKAAGFDGVTKWLDRSGNGNDVSQSTLADCPYFDAATNSIIFTGTQNLITSGNIGLTGDFTIFEVKAYSDVTEVVDTVGINGNLIRNIGSGSERNVWSTTPDNNSTRLVNNTFAITAQNLEDGVSGNFWTNGVKDDAFSDTTMVRTDGPLKINQDTGIVGELRYKAVLYWNRKLTDSEMATVFKYLNDLYGVY